MCCSAVLSFGMSVRVCGSRETSEWVFGEADQKCVLDIIASRVQPLLHRDEASHVAMVECRVYTSAAGSCEQVSSLQRKGWVL